MIAAGRYAMLCVSRSGERIEKAEKRKEYFEKAVRSSVCRAENRKIDTQDTRKTAKIDSVANRQAGIA